MSCYEMSRQQTNEVRPQIPTLARGEHMHDHGETLEVYKKWADTKEKQRWVQEKTKHPDHIIFTHVGGFFEFFHQDADVMHEVCEAVYMKGEVAHTGIPQSVFLKIQEKLKESGYDKISII